MSEELFQKIPDKVSNNFVNLLESTKKFGALTVVGYGGKNERGHSHYWWCQCDCGKLTRVRGSHLSGEKIVSCGCHTSSAIIKHNMHKTVEYKTWMHMKMRCNDHKNKKYHLYGGRGIKVCERWLESFENFYEDMGKRPSNNHSIDRINGNEDYYPENCRWATIKEQNNNTSRNVYLEYNGEKKTVHQWSEVVGIKPGVLHSRIKKGWSVENILFTPIKEKKKVVYNGIEYSIQELADLSCLKRHVVESRIKLGWDIDKVVSTNLKEVTRYEFNGKLLSIGELSQELNIPVETIYSRIYNGWDINDIINTPINKNLSRRKNA